MIGPVLESITFRSSNKFQPVIEALGIIKRTLNDKGNYFHEPVPITGIVTPNWESLVFENVKGEQKVVRKYYELCALQCLERALKCKEVWAEGSLNYRNPDEDMPSDWEDVTRRVHYYTLLKQPLDAISFINPLRKQLDEALTAFNEKVPHLDHLEIKDGKFLLSKLVARPELINTDILKDAIISEYGMVDLLGMFVTADRITNFTQHFKHSGTKEMRSREQLRPPIILNVFAEATNVGVKRVSRSNPVYDYSELLYVRKTYFTPENLQNALTEVTNKILQLRNPKYWGVGNACASDGKAFGSWDQNLMSEWRTRHKGYGVVIYWHVETNAVCIYSQLKNFSSSEVAAMIEGLVRHGSQAEIDRNYVDSHGQSKIAFAFCKLLNRFRLMPRLNESKTNGFIFQNREPLKDIRTLQVCSLDRFIGIIYSINMMRWLRIRLLFSKERGRLKQSSDGTIRTIRRTQHSSFEGTRECRENYLPL
ncbi:Tn3 family transposase [bacterium]|nr:Tn3 family transposase [bacterium]